MHTKQIVLAWCALALGLAAMSPANAYASQGCAAAAAAAAGNQEALQRSISTAQDHANNQEEISSLMDRCLSGIAGVQTGSFPNLSSIFEQIEQRVCSTIVGTINRGVRSVNNGIVSQTTGLQDIYGAAPTATGGTVNSQSRPIAPAPSSSSMLPEFLQHLF